MHIHICTCECMFGDAQLNILGLHSPVSLYFCSILLGIGLEISCRKSMVS